MVSWRGRRCGQGFLRPEVFVGRADARLSDAAVRVWAQQILGAGIDFERLQALFFLLRSGVSDLRGRLFCGFLFVRRLLFFLGRLLRRLAARVILGRRFIVTAARAFGAAARPTVGPTTAGATVGAARGGATTDGSTAAARAATA
jgi:hypothetical protein